MKINLEFVWFDKFQASRLVMDRFYNFTCCIRCKNIEFIEEALTNILEQEGSCRIPLPPLSIEDVKKRYYRQLSCELWMIGLFVGAAGWTIVKTFPQELLCHRARGADRPRLSELATRINSDAFYLGVYEREHPIFVKIFPVR